MMIRCPNCSTTYEIEGAAFDAPRPTFRCSRCKHVFAIQIRLHDEDEDAAETAAPPTPEGPPSVDPGPEPEDGLDAREPADTGGPTHTESSEPEPEPPETGAAQRSAEPPEPAPEPEPEIEPVSYPEPEPEFELEPERETEPEPPAPSAATARTDGDPVRVADLGEADFPPPDFEPPAARTALPDPRQPDTRPRSASGSVTTAPTDPRQPDLPEPAPATETIDLPRQSARPSDFRIDDDDLVIPPRETRSAPPRAADGSGSIVPFVSLVGLAVFAFVLVSVIYQMSPQALDSLIRRIPWYGEAVFENRHFKRTLAFESLVSGVQPALNQQEVFVVSGKLVNGNDRGIHRVQVEAQLFDAEGKPLARQAIFLGNAISAKIIKEMSLREIALLQSLKPQNPYPIPPNESVNFTIVFPKPEAPVESFSCRVLSAEAASSPGPA